MELRVLKYFLAVAREENITRAAALLHVTQPTLSRQLMQLEQELGVKLFHRSRHRIVLTPDGLLLRRRAQEIVDLAGKAERELAGGEAPLTGEVTIGCGETRNMEALARMIAAFQTRYPDVRFDIYTAVADDVKERIANGTLDMGLLVEPVEFDAYNYVRMPLRERWCVLMRRDAPLAQKACIAPADLAGQRVIIPGRLAVRNEWEHWLGDVYASLQVVATCNLSYSNRSLLVANGMGLSLTHEFDNGDSRLCLRPITPEMANTSVLVWPKDQALSPTVSRFVAHIKNTLQA